MNAEVFETDPEVIFEPYSAVNPAKRGSKQSLEASFYDKSKLELVEEFVAPAQAFEVFAGKIYKPLSKQTEYEVSGGMDCNSITKSASKKQHELESPLERFTRLTQEVRELEDDLELLVKSDTSSKQDQTRVLVDAAQAAEYGEIMNGLDILKSNLLALQSKQAYQPYLSDKPFLLTQPDATLALQKELTSQFFQQLEAIKKNKSIISNDEENDDPMSSIPEKSSNSKQPCLIYEIYSTGEVNAVEKDAKNRILALEARLFTLEKTIGDFQTISQPSLDPLGTHNGKDLTSILDKLEKRLELLNERNLDAIKTRTNALMHEFNRLSVLKEKKEVQQALATSEDKKKFNHLFDKFKQVEETSVLIPFLVERLTTLKNIHDEHLDLHTRMKQLETTKENIQQLLQRDANLLTNMEKSLEENARVFEGNMSNLDTRMEILLKRLATKH